MAAAAEAKLSQFRHPAPEPVFARNRLAWAVLFAGVLLSVLAVRMVPQFVRQDAGIVLAWWISLSGLLISTLLALLLVALTRARSHAHSLAERMTAQLRESETRLAETQHIARLGNWSYEFDRRRLACSEEARHLVGLNPAESAPSYRDFLRLVQDDDRKVLQALIHAAARQGRGFDTDFRTRGGGEKMRWLHLVSLPIVNELGQVCTVRGTVMDVTERKQAERSLSESASRMKFLANYDPLTTLPNRSMFHQGLQRALVRAQRYNRTLALLFIDLDRFKNINDTLGHDAGDEVLRTVAARLQGALREADMVARLGGDEFVVLVEEVSDARLVAAVAQKLIKSVAEPFLLGAREYRVTASIGISTYPADGADGATLLKNADIAMYRAKEQGKNNSQYYAASMNTHSLERLALETSLRGALERDELVLHFQPKIEIGNGQLTGMEALVRWSRPGAGMVPPADFIPIAEETGLIVAIGEWVLKHACKHNYEWGRGDAPPLRVAVNLSARQFAQANLVSDVARILDVTGLEPLWLELEITESMVMHNPEQAIRTLHQLKSLGISIALDDFGTGYSSLGYLKRFPLDFLKIDRSFIRDIPEDNDDATITRTIISMAHNLRLKVIAEGVETEAQYNFLREHGCDEIQGYIFSRPLPAAEFHSLIQAQHRKSMANAA